MAKQRSAGSRILIYLFLIAVMLVSGSLLLDTFGLVSVGEILMPIRSALGWIDRSDPLDAEDPFLLADERLKKREESLALQLEELDAAKKALEEAELEFQVRLSALEEREQIQEDRELSFSETQRQADSRETNLEAVSNYLTGMPPQSAVSIIGEMDVQDIIDIMRKVDEIALANGTPSIVAFWLQLINDGRVEDGEVLREPQPDLAAEIQRKMVRKPNT
jgi:flagellar protein FlbB